MSVADQLPALVHAFETREDRGQELLSEVHRHVAWVTRSYPDAYFVLNRKNDESVADLGNRVFTSCARIEKGRFPFQGRRPFRCFVEEGFDGRAIRYHSFYAKLSITREMLRDDYARNLSRDPVLKWRATLYKDIGTVLKASAESVPQGRGLPPRWQLPSSGPRMLRSLDAVEARLKRMEDASVKELVLAALSDAGPLTQARLTHLLEAVLGTPEAEEPPAPITESTSDEQLAVRRAVQAGWNELDDADRLLLLALARGDSYDDLIAAHPAFKHRVAVSRAVSRVGKRFVSHIERETGMTVGKGPSPKLLVDLILQVLGEIQPQLDEEARHGA